MPTRRRGDALGGDQANLESVRRRENELTELRTVEPLLREHDRALTDLQALAEVPDLPESAREERLGARTGAAACTGRYAGRGAGIGPL